MRKNWIDIAKGVAIILVCLGHTKVEQVPFVGPWIYSFHMPFFFLIAGYCYDSDRYASYGAYVVRKCKGLLYPYVMLSLIVPVLMQILTWKFGPLWYIFTPYLGNWMIGFWFVRVLLLVELVYAVFRWKLWGWGLAIVGLVLICIECKRPFGLDFDYVDCFRPIVVLISCCFYHIGHLLRRVDFAALSIRMISALTAVSIVCHLLFLLMSRFAMISCGGCSLGGNPLAFVGGAVAGSVALMGVAVMMDKIRYCRETFAWIGRNSLILLAFHPMVGMARHKWVLSLGQWAVLSYVFELVIIAVLMLIFAGPLNRLVRFPPSGKGGKK